METPALGIALWGLAVFTLLGLVFGFALAAAAMRFHVPVNPLVERVRDVLPVRQLRRVRLRRLPGLRRGGGRAPRGGAQPVRPGPRARWPRRSPRSPHKEVGSVLDRVVVHALPRHQRLRARRGRVRGRRRPAPRPRWCSAAPRRARTAASGLGDCVRVCPFDALHLGAAGIAEVDAEKCTGCGLCVPACPKDLFTLYPRAPPHRAVVRGARQAGGGARDLHGGLHAVPQVRRQVSGRRHHLGRPHHPDRSREVPRLRTLVRRGVRGHLSERHPASRRADAAARAGVERGRRRRLTA